MSQHDKLRAAPFAVFDEFGIPCDDRVTDYGRQCHHDGLATGGDRHVAAADRACQGGKGRCSMSAAITSGSATADKALWAKCPACSHCWPAAYYPVDLRTVARVVGGTVCPKGCLEPSMLAKQHDGVLQEVQAS